MNAAIAWDVIESFIGFGNPEAEVLFLGMEEGLSAGASLEDDLLARSQYQPYEDLLEAQLMLGAPSRFFGANPKAQRTWRPMCHLMLRREGETIIDNAMRCRYQADRLGRRNQNRLLAELLPYPNPNTQVWHYTERFADREQMVSARISLLRKAFLKSRFKIVVAYGSANWDHYKSTFETDGWAARGQFQVSQKGSTRILLAPHFCSRAYNTAEQLDNFANLAIS